MLKTIIRISGLAIVVMALHVATATASSSSGNTTPILYQGYCTLNYDTILPMSDCSTSTSTSTSSGSGTSSAGQTLGGQTSTSSTGNVAANNAISSTSGQSGGGSNLNWNPGLTSMGYFDVSPASGRLSIRGVSGGGAYSRTVFSDNASGLGYSRISQTGGITASYIQNFGDWGYSVVLPVTRTWDNGGYSAFDNTSVGLAVVPVYHLLFEQVEGISLDVGGVLAGQYTSYDDPSALANGRLGLTGFVNPSSGQVGGFVRAAKPLAAGTSLSLGAAFVEDHNFSNQGVFGGDSTIATADLGMTHRFSRALLLAGDLKSVNLNQYKWGITRHYGQGDLSLYYSLTHRASLLLHMSRTFGNSTWSTTGVAVNLVWWLD